MRPSHPLEKKSGLKPTHQNPPMILVSPNIQADRLQGKKRISPHFPRQGAEWIKMERATGLEPATSSLGS
jgi:hypothetical protein